MRGYNFSSRPPHPSDYRLPLLVEDVRALLRFANRTSAVVCGHDWGAFVAAAFAAMHPELVHKLVLLSAGHPNAYMTVRSNFPDAKRMSRYILLLAIPYVPRAFMQRFVSVV